ncbi:hypothetical protein LIER_19902 [Lithospermum erythrorhizon]|uniref:GAG-pre-integrase domain-containing protein n=1 Tax=Lithospermum erythrorhizon TaxID=34254 RepID=A0AAV3QJF6_LITER
MHNVRNLQSTGALRVCSWLLLLLITIVFCSIVGIAAQVKGLYVLDENSFKDSIIQKFLSNFFRFSSGICTNVNMVLSEFVVESNLWHARLGHSSIDVLKHHNVLKECCE